MNSEYQNYLISNFGFAQIPLADKCTNFKFLTKDEVNINDIFFGGSLMPSRDYRMSIFKDRWFIEKVNDKIFLVHLDEIFEITLDNEEKYHWKEFGFFVEEFNNLLGE